MGKAALIPDDADPATGFSPRGAVVEEGVAARSRSRVNERDRVWAHNVASLYDQATAQQWDASPISRGRACRSCRPTWSARCARS